ncbi:MAG: phage portal protein [Elusimicrobiota bacterium]|jgi:lambda family phage portal protein|nr:phage portal protein [Elusimicrobiota bacterium]
MWNIFKIFRRKKVSEKAIGIAGNLYAPNFFNVFGGSKIKGSLNYPSSIAFDTQTLRNRSRKAIFETPQAKSFLRRLTENVVNSGLTLELSPIWDLLDIEIEKQEKNTWIRRVEKLWKIYADSKDAIYDKKKTLNQSQAIWYQNYLRDGEIFLVLRYSSDLNRLNPLSVQTIAPENIYTPLDYKTKKGNVVIDGIEYSSSGEEIAYFIHDSLGNYKRVLKYDSNNQNRLFVIHSFITEYADQIRGIPFLSGVLHELQKVTDYSLLELQSAIINAILAIYIQPSQNADASLAFGTGGAVLKEKIEPQETINEPKNEPKLDKEIFTRGGIILQNLKAGEDVKSFDTKRPNVNFDTFVNSIVKNLSASLSIPVEVLFESFNANYSASRASLVLFWNNVIMERDNFAVEVLDPIFEAWMMGEIELGRIEANGFERKLERKAWTNNRWIGINQPSIDPLKEANASVVRIQEGLTTREIEAQKYNGTSFDENVEILREENKLLNEVNIAEKVVKEIVEEEEEE